MSQMYVRQCSTEAFCCEFIVNNVMNYSQQEKVNMIYCIGESRGNCFLASRLYAQEYPGRRHPDNRVFERVKNVFEDTGSVMLRKRQKRKTATDENNTLSTMLHIQENPHVSTRTLSREVEISQKSISRIIRGNKFHPYHMQLMQNLNDNDFIRRRRFCEWVLNRTQEQPDFFDYVLFSDEATFHNNGNVNRHNLHYYATENPHFRRYVDNQHRWSLNVWGGIVGTHLVGPHFFDGRINAEIYLDFLRHILPNLLEDIPLATLRRLWLQQDGAPAHYGLISRQYVEQEFQGRWIGRGGPISWPPRSPDLTKLDFFLWGYIKGKVYETAVTTRENMMVRIREAFQEISRETLQNVNDSFLRRARLCLQENGGHFEHLIS